MKVLLALESEPYASSEIEFALSHCSGIDCEYKLIHVVEPVDFADRANQLYGSSRTKELMDERVHHAEQQMEGWRSRLANESRGRVETLIVVGLASRSIIETARLWKAQLVIVGSHGRNGLERLFPGSTSLNVVTDSACPVAVIHLAPVCDPLDIQLCTSDLPAAMVGCGDSL
jgi:nucleotide-binding universal stress UspA family protein